MVIITFHLSKLGNTRFSILCDVVFLVRLQEKFEIDHSTLGVKGLACCSELQQFSICHIRLFHWLLSVLFLFGSKKGRVCFSQIVEELKSIANQRPGVAELFSLGRSYEGRHQYAVKVGFVITPTFLFGGL